VETLEIFAKKGLISIRPIISRVLKYPVAAIPIAAYSPFSRKIIRKNKNKFVQNFIQNTAQPGSEVPLALLSQPP
jgi:hypothetical protein